MRSTAVATDLSESKKELTKPLARYWYQKRLDPNFHSGTRCNVCMCSSSPYVALDAGSHGGFRWSKHGVHNDALIKLYLMSLVRAKPAQTAADLKGELASVGVVVNVRTVQRWLKQCGLSSKVPQHKQVRRSDLHFIGRPSSHSAVSSCPLTRRWISIHHQTSIITLNISVGQCAFHCTD
jgi:hypothetical protein